MTLAALRSAIRDSNGPVTGIELASQLGISPGEVAAMIDALRASGYLTADPSSVPVDGECASAGGCTLSCPGPSDCALAIDLTVTSLEIRRPTSV